MTTERIRRGKLRRDEQHDDVHDPWLATEERVRPAHEQCDCNNYGEARQDDDEVYAPARLMSHACQMRRYHAGCALISRGLAMDQTAKLALI